MTTRGVIPVTLYTEMADVKGTNTVRVRAKYIILLYRKIEYSSKEMCAGVVYRCKVTCDGWYRDDHRESIMSIGIIMGFLRNRISRIFILSVMLLYIILFNNIYVLAKYTERTIPSRVWYTNRISFFFLHRYHIL